MSNLEVLELRRSGTRHEPVFLCQDTGADSRHGTRRGSLEVSTDQLDALHVACQIDQQNNEQALNVWGGSVVLRCTGRSASQLNAAESDDACNIKTSSEKFEVAQSGLVQ